MRKGRHQAGWRQGGGGANAYIDWGTTIWDENIPWTLELVKKHEPKWKENNYLFKGRDYEILRNPAIANLDGILDYLSDRFDIPFLLQEGMIPCTEEIFEQNIDKIDIAKVSNYRFKNLDFIEKYQDRLEWRFVSSANLDWTEEFIEKFSHKIDWKRLSFNSSLPLSISFIDRFINKWDWHNLSRNNGFKYKEGAAIDDCFFEWTEGLINYYSDQIEWKSLSRNYGLKCSNEFLEKNAHKFDWGNSGLSRVPSINWTEEFIEKYKEKLGWGKYGLSWNFGLCWTPELINRYEDRWEWNGLSLNRGLCWSMELIEKYKDKWNWGFRWRSYGLGDNKTLPWSIELIETYKDRFPDSWPSTDAVWEKVIYPNLDFDLVKQILKMK